MKKLGESVALAIKWFNGLSDAHKIAAVKVMLETLIEMDHVRIFDEETAVELAGESGKSVEEFLAPYWESCGEPIIDVSK